MLYAEVVAKLDKMFISRYGKQFADLNKNVYPTAKNDKGNYEVPVVIVGSNGGTLIKGNSEGAVQLNPPAQVSLQFRNMKPQTLIYRLSIPYSECEIAVNKPEYFAYLFDEIVLKALNNYKVTVGDENKARFGEVYCSYERPDKSGVFRQLEDTSLELRLYGSWASGDEAYD